MTEPRTDGMELTADQVRTLIRATDAIAEAVDALARSYTERSGQSTAAVSDRVRHAHGDLTQLLRALTAA